MDDLGLYLLFFIPPLLIGLGVQSWLKRTVARHASESVQSGLTGAEVARAILDRNGLSDVPIEPTGGAPLSDHYDPRSRIVRLSPTVFGERSVTATAIGAHEVGHAIQHARAYTPMRIRSAIFPAVAFSSNIWMILLLAGVFLQVAGLVVVAIALYAVAVLFQLVTLPVEFDASRRAGKQVAGAESRRRRRGRRREVGPQRRCDDLRRRCARSHLAAPVFRDDVPGQPGLTYEARASRIAAANASTSSGVVANDVIQRTSSRMASQS